MLKAGTVLNDRYEIKEKIGAGGMSIVYKAKCRKLQRYVAIKVLRDEYAKDEEFLASFRAEALSAASLSHPNIVGIYDVGNDLGWHYIVMEYVEGRTLKEIIEQGAPYDTQKVLEYGIDILSAVRHAHMKKIIHRDIKPQNILVTNDQILKVTDFGIARAVDSSTIVSTGTAIGSVHYFSPEQAKGKYVDETSDLYSCGIVLFELATGRLPFEADSHVTVALKHINEEIPMPSTVNKEIAPTLEKIILKATQKRPELRYARAEDMLQDLRRLSSNPSYKISDPLEDMSQKTILMTQEETNLIRKNANLDKELQIPSWQNTIPKTTPNPTPYVNNLDDLDEPIESIEEIGEDGDGDEEVSKTYTAMVTVAGILAAMVLIGIVMAFALPWVGKVGKPKVVVVPNLLETHIDKATEELKKKGLGIKVVDEEEAEGVPVGEILRQSPAKEKVVPLGTIIEVIISKEIELEDEFEYEDEGNVVPSIIGMDFGEAQGRLLDIDLILQVADREYDDRVEEGKIISQNPINGNLLAPGEIVSVVVSRGKEAKTTFVPKLIGKDEDAAIGMLRTSGLKVSINYEESDTVDKGIVIRQGIPAGREVEQLVSISLTISKGKAEEPEPEPQPEPEPEPEPQPEPEPEPEPQPQPEPEPEQPPKEVTATKRLTISIPEFLEEKDNYQVLIRLVGDSGGTSTVYSGQVSLDQFPLSVSVKGTGTGTVETYIDNEQIYADPIDFNEVGQ